MTALLFIPYAVVTVLLAIATQGLLNRPLGSLDEQQVHVRRSLFREPYGAGVGLGLVGGLVVSFVCYRAMMRIGRLPEEERVFR